MFHRSVQGLLTTAAFFAVSASSQPLSPDESLATMELEPGFKAELFASEPDIVDPVAITFDEWGRVYVAEMREMEVLPALQPGAKGTIRLLEDSDGDGRLDRSTVFADGLSFPSGIAPYEGGVYALCTPDLLYLKDTDGDRVADERRVVLTGFAQGNAEHRFNNLTWGIDNWIYAANGHGGGKVRRPDQPESEALDLTNRDFRFDPRTESFESESRQMPGGFGLAFDDWGRRFVCHNEMHAMHVVLVEKYLRRDPNLIVRNTSENISADGRIDSVVYPLSAAQQWRIERTNRRSVEMADRFRDSQLQASGYFTAACGVTVYRGGLFPESHQGNLFSCDAAQNLVHRDILEETGASMSARRALEGSEFLRSSDQWFRPVNLEVGPDGALYLVDFYRDVIETAASIPDDILGNLDLRAGSDRGRIYRISPEHQDEPYRPIDWGEDESKDLVGKLSDPNAWVRLTAQRLLIEREAFDQTGRLQETIRDETNPLGRLHALWTLEGLGKLDEDLLLHCLDDPHPRIREHAVKLAEYFLGS